MIRGRLIPFATLAKDLGWKRSRLRRLVDTKQIPHLRIGARRDVYFEERAIEAWLERQRVAAVGTSEPAPRTAHRTLVEECRALGVDEPDEAFV